MLLFNYLLGNSRERRIVLIIKFNKLEDIIADEKELIITIGPLLAKLLKQRINQIQSFDNFYEYRISGLGKPHPLQGDLSDCFGIHLTGNYRMCIKPLTEDLSNNGLKECVEAELKGVLDYHGDKYSWVLR